MEYIFHCNIYRYERHDFSHVSLLFLVYDINSTSINQSYAPKMPKIINSPWEEDRYPTLTTELRTSVISVRPSGGSGHETAGLDLSNSHHHHHRRRFPLVDTPAASSCRPQQHTRASALPRCVEHGWGSEETSCSRCCGQPCPGRFLTTLVLGNFIHKIPLEHKPFKHMRCISYALAAKWVSTGVCTLHSLAC